jgi:acetyl-CoA synthetase
LGTKELEAAALTVEEVAEAAVVPTVDDLRGRIPEMYIALKPGYKPDKGVEEKVKDAIDKIIGKVARPRNVWLVPDMPKTRSGKIMRRVIASVSNFMDVGDVTTLANPEVVETIRKMVQAEKAKRGEVPKDLSKEMLEEIKRFGAVE